MFSGNSVVVQNSQIQRRVETAAHFTYPTAAAASINPSISTRSGFKAPACRALGLPTRALYPQVPPGSFFGFVLFYFGLLWAILSRAPLSHSGLLLRWSVQLHLLPIRASAPLMCFRFTLPSFIFLYDLCHLLPVLHSTKPSGLDVDSCM